MIRIPFTTASEVIMKIRQLHNPEENGGSATWKRAECESVVKRIIEDVRSRRDKAVRYWSEYFDGAALQKFEVTTDEMERARQKLSLERVKAIEFSANAIRKTAEEIVKNLKDICFNFYSFRVSVELSPVERVLCYVPGGRFSLTSSLLMSAVVARVSGVTEIYATSPKPSEELLAAASVVGVKSLFRIGGAQAIAAFAFGTETVPKVDIVVGPGNIYVTEAKRLLFGVVGTDTPAGPSELLIIADSGAKPRDIALDLLAQAEHSPDALSVLVSLDEKLINDVEERIYSLLKETETSSWLSGKADCLPAVFCDEKEAVALANELAPEHIELLVAEPSRLAVGLRNYGALFCGYGNSAVFGDYSAATNHILPTGGSAKFASAVSPLTFLRLRYRTDLTDIGKIGPVAECASELAGIEKLPFHKARAKESIK